MKATKLTLAAVLLAGTCGFAMAQGGGAGGEGPKGSDANPPAAVKAQPGETKSAPAQGAQARPQAGTRPCRTRPHRRPRAPRLVQRVTPPARART